MERKFRTAFRFSSVFPVALFILCWGWVIWLTYYASGNILDADASSVLVLSNFLAQEHAIVSTGWRYYTELHLFNMQMIYSFFFHFFSSWRLVRFFGMVTLQALLTSAYWFLCRQTKLSRNAFFYSATALLLPVSVTYSRITLLHGYYTFHFILMFLIVGLLLNSAKMQMRKKAGRLISIALYLALCLVSGLNGMRLFYICIMPSLLLSLFLYLRSPSFRDFASEEKKDHAKLLRGLFRSASASAEGRGLLLSIFGTLANGLGIATNVLVLRKFFGFSTYFSLQTFELSLGEFEKQCNDLLNMLGYRSGAHLFSVEGVCSLFAVLSLFILLGFSIWYFTRKNKDINYEKHYASTFFLGTLLVQTMVFLITTNYFIHYSTPIYIAIMPLLAILIDEFPNYRIRMPKVCALIILTGFILSGFVTTNYLVNKPENYATKYEGLTSSNIDQVQQILPVAKFLERNGYTFGYANYWDSSIVTELTDGKVEVCAIIEPPDITYSFANTKKAFWDIDYHSGKTFIIFKEFSTDWQEYPILQGGKEVYTDEYYKVFEYPAPIPFEKSRFAD